MFLRVTQRQLIDRQIIDNVLGIRDAYNDWPIYLISDGADPVSRYEKGLKALEETLRNSGKMNITSHLYPEARHELLNEINKEEIYRDLFAWLGD